MKKEYIAPQMEAIEMKNEVQILAGSTLQNIAGGVFDPEVTAGNEPGRAPEFLEMALLLFDE